MKFSIRGAIWETIRQLMKDDSRIFVMGEGAKVKMSFDCPRILRRWPERVVTTPIAEAGIVNVALGAALYGMRPVIDLTFNDLALRANEEIINEVAKAHFITGGKCRARVVIKADFNRPENAQSGNRYESIFAGTMGLRVAIPSTPSEASFFVNYALKSNDPFLLFEDRIIDKTEEIDTESCKPFGKARIVKRGNALTVATYGYGVVLAEEASRELQDIDLIDLRSLNPMDWSTVLNSVRVTRRLLVVEPDRAKFGVGAEIVATAAESCRLRAASRVGSKESPFAADSYLQSLALPTVTEVKKSMERSIRK